MVTFMLADSWVECLMLACPGDSPAYAALVSERNVRLEGLATLPNSVILKCEPVTARILLDVATRVCPEAVGAIRAGIAEFQRAETQRVK